MTLLSARQAYRLWAPNYRGDNAVCALEDLLMTKLTPSPQDRRLLDVGCGTGLRLKNCGAALAMGVDASPEMLAASGLANVATAEVGALPFAAAMFDLVWSRLMMSYLPDLAPPYAELARVCRAGGQVVVSDFHVDASRAGHRQTFRDGNGVLHEIAHHAHDAEAHVTAAASAGLCLTSRHDGAVGPAIRPFYEKAGRLDIYARDEGLCIIALFVFSRA